MIQARKYRGPRVTQLDVLFLLLSHYCRDKWEGRTSTWNRQRAVDRVEIGVDSGFGVSRVPTILGLASSDSVPLPLLRTLLAWPLLAPLSSGLLGQSGPATTHIWQCRPRDGGRLVFPLRPP
jgi:hypothetical protein